MLNLFLRAWKQYQNMSNNIRFMHTLIRPMPIKYLCLFPCIFELINEILFLRIRAPVVYFFFFSNKMLCHIHQWLFSFEKKKVKNISDLKVNRFDTAEKKQHYILLKLCTMKAQMASIYNQTDIHVSIQTSNHLKSWYWKEITIKTKRLSRGMQW